MNYRLLLILHLVFFLSTMLYGQMEDPHFVIYDIENGLPSSEAYDVHAAQDGRIFITTDRGVSIYDGYTFSNYSMEDGLASNTNFLIQEDLKGRLWLNGMEGGLTIYEGDRFYPFEGNKQLDSILKKTWVRELFFDKGGDVFFWNRTLEEGKYKYHSFVKRDSALQFEYLDIKEITQQQEEEYIFCRIGGIYFITQYLSGRPPIPLEKINNGFIGAENKSLFYTDLSGKLIKRIELDYMIDGVFIDHQSNLWVATFSGLYLYEEGRLEQTPIRYFRDLSITNICQDFEGNYWISTLTNGVLFVPSFDIKVFKNISGKFNTEKILTAASLTNHITFSTSEGGIFSINRQFEKQILLNNQAAKEQFRFANHNDNRIYYSGGYIFNEENDSLGNLSSFFDSDEYKNIEAILTKELRDNLQHTGGIKLVKKLKNGDYLIVGVNGVLILYENKKSEPTYYINPFSEIINSVLEDDDGTIWLGTSTGLYYVQNYDYKNIQRTASNQHHKIGRIEDLLIDKHQNRWMATIGNGLFYKTKTKTYQITKTDGLNSIYINSIHQSNDSTLYAGSNDGLYQLNFSAGVDTFRLISIQRFSTVDGLPSNYINDIHFFNDHLWLATNRGVSYFKFQNLKRSYPLIPIEVNRVSVNNEVQDQDSSLIFNHNQNDIYFQYTAVSYRKDKKAFYRYRLNSDGVKQPWFYTNERNVRYSNLAPGDYIFEVAAQNKSGVWNNPSGNGINFKIRPHFSQTIWFRILTGLLLLAAIGFILFNQTKRIQQKEQQKRLLKESEHRTREAELTALRGQMNPHFVFNSLNAIQHFIFKKDAEKANFFLAKFSRLMRDSLELSRLEYIPLKKEIAFLKNYLELEMLRFPEKFSYHFHVEEVLLEEEYLVPSLMLQPVLENAIKHAFRDIDYPGVLEINVCKNKTETALELIIQDNGLGLGEGLPNVSKYERQQAIHQSLSLQIVQNRINLLQQKDGDAIASFTIVDRKKSVPSSKGLRVEFIIPIKLTSYD